MAAASRGDAPGPAHLLAPLPDDPLDATDGKGKWQALVAPPLSIYRALGGLRQDRGWGAKSLAKNGICGNWGLRNAKAVVAGSIAKRARTDG